MIPEILVDARGMLCPWPVLRLGRAARSLVGPGHICVLADDPAAAGEIEALCSERGWCFARDPERPGTFQVEIR